MEDNQRRTTEEENGQKDKDGMINKDGEIRHWVH